METQTKVSGGAKDFFLNLGAFVSLYILVGNLFSLLFTIIDTAYPKISDSYNYYGSSSLSWPVSALVVLFPIFIFLMWLLAKSYAVEPEKQHSITHRWFAYITLFLSGAIVVGDLITVIYYFIDGQELTAGFLLKVLVLLIISSSLFMYFISDLMGKLNTNSRMVWRFVAFFIVVGSIAWGFAVLGSHKIQRLYKYDEQKVNDLQSFQSEIGVYFSTNNSLPDSLESLETSKHFSLKKDSQDGKPYEYKKTGKLSYELCAEFNKASNDKISKAYPYGGALWIHPAGRYCFSETINPNIYSYPKAMPISY